ncbi:MAG: hypothetical protein U0457_03180 [Candidatus Sericytochromatia bacterium]
MIKILDCTLRDGGYINNWQFEKNFIKKILISLNKSNIDITELGYLKSNLNNGNNFSTIFDSIKKVDNFIDDLELESNSELFLMVDYGKFDFSLLEKSKYIKGLRLAFHKKDFNNIFEISNKIIALGYKLSIQPMVIDSYEEKELCDLLEKISNYNIDSFYIVDSFGSLFPKDINKYFDLINVLLDKKIKIGLHSHNNISASFLCAKEFIDNRFDREIIIDSTINGIGRGAGNLATEYITYYLEKFHQKNYFVKELLETNFFDKEFSNKFKYFYSGLNKIHPEKVELFF